MDNNEKWEVCIVINPPSAWRFKGNLYCLKKGAATLSFDEKHRADKEYAQQIADKLNS